MCLDDLRCRLMRIINDRLDVRALTAHHTIDRHVQPASYTGNIVRIGLAGTVLDSRKRRSRDTDLVSDVTQTHLELVAVALDSTSEVGRVDQVFVFESHFYSFLHEFGSVTDGRAISW